MKIIIIIIIIFLGGFPVAGMKKKVMRRNFSKVLQCVKLEKK